jgi:N-acetylneuraminic acid mutarotase
LLNGKVLVVGGGDGSKGLNSAELYDPATETWSYTGGPAIARGNHTATLLASGKVLVTGGSNSDSLPGTLNSAELYDPVTGTWGATGSLISARGSHTATLLQDGKVLVAGGTAGLLPDAELYDSATGTWSATGNLDRGFDGQGRSRAGHEATLLANGKVLVEGGFDEDDPNSTDPFIFSSAEMYDPNTETWTGAGSMNTSRDSHTATLLEDGRVLVCGGHPLSPNSSELYDPADGTWKFTGNLNKGRYYLGTATLLAGGKVLVAGGVTDFGVPLDTAELYDPATERWIITQNIGLPRCCHTATLLENRKVLIAGGSADPGIALNSAMLYDPGLPILVPRITAASVEGKKLFIFGEDFDVGAVILLNGDPQATLNDPGNPQTVLIGKKAGKKIKPGDKIQVRNSTGALSQEFTFAGAE